MYEWVCDLFGIQPIGTDGQGLVDVVLNNFSPSSIQTILPYSSSNSRNSNQVIAGPVVLPLFKLFSVTSTNESSAHSGWGWFIFKLWESIDAAIPTGLIIGSCIAATVSFPPAGILLLPVAAAAGWCYYEIVKNIWKDFSW
jgi:hypothetical protein